LGAQGRNSDALIGTSQNPGVWLRRAIVLGFDTEELAKVAYGGQALSINQIMAPGVAGHDPSIPPKVALRPACSTGLA